MREGWECKKLGEVAKISSGKAIPSSDIFDTFSEGLYPCYGGNGLRGYVDHYSNDGLVPVIGRVGALCGNVHLPHEKFYATEHALVVNLKTNDKPHFIQYLLSSLNLRQYAKGVAQPVLSASTLSEIPIPLPPLSEQQRIVSELDLLSGIIEKKNEQLKEYDLLAQSIFYDMFGSTNDEKGWEIKKFGEVGTFQRGGGFLKSDFVEKGFPCIHYGQIHTKFGFYTYNNLTSISKELAISKSRIAHKGDVIIAITSEDVEGSCKSVAWMGDNDVAIGAHAAIFSHNQNPIYVSYYFRSAEYNRAKERYARGFKVVEIKPDDIAKIDIPLPPLSLQQSFAEKIEAIDRQKALVQQSITETETLFNSRMDYWFS